MTALIQLSSSTELASFIRDNPCCLVTYSAHWCGPCKQSKPQLEALAQQYASTFKMGIAYESDVDVREYNVRAFPTYVVCHNGTELQRVEGANIQAVDEMIKSHLSKAGGSSGMPTTGGTSLGGGSGSASPADARAARLAKLGGGTAATAAASSPPAESDSKPSSSEDVEMKDESTKEESKDTAMDTSMTDAAANAGAEAAADATTEEDPCANLDKEALDNLTSSMGFSLLRAQKGLLYGGPTVEAAVEWLMQHQDDDNIDEPIPKNAGGGGGIAQSYKCNECGKVLSNMANLELHANKTGHSDFEESTESVVPLTAEQKAAKIIEIKSLLASKRAERENKEKEEAKEREKQRRFAGKEMAKTREQLEIETRKREAQLRRKQKEDYNKERARLRAELAKDKAERQAHKGKLSSKLSAEGYKPDGIQYDVEQQAAEGGSGGGGDGGGAGSSSNSPSAKKKMKADASKIDEYITKVSSYKAGGDGGRCLKVLKAYIGNVVDHPDDPKYKTINMENKAFKIKVKPFLGAKNLLLAVGFNPNEGNTALVLSDDDAATNQQVLASTKQKLEAALVSYG